MHRQIVDGEMLVVNGIQVEVVLLVLVVVVLPLLDKQFLEARTLVVMVEVVQDIVSLVRPNITEVGEEAMAILLVALVDLVEVEMLEHLILQLQEA